MEVCAPYFIWGILFVLAVVAEIVSFQLVSIWFAAGALAAFLAACFGGSVMLQIILFLAAAFSPADCEKNFFFWYPGYQHPGNRTDSIGHSDH